MADFRQVQKQLTDWIRQPEVHAPPGDAPLHRLHIYRELFFNNIAGFVENSFPEVKKRLPDEVWNRLVQGFFAGHHCQSPYFRDISQEFLKYLPHCPETRLYPWLLELAHFEWAEIAADVAEGEWPVAAAGDVWTQTPVISPFVWPLVYAWPVHALGEEIPSNPPLAPTALIIYRTQNHEVRYLQSTLPGAALIEQLQNEPAPLTVMANQLADSLGLDQKVLSGLLGPAVDAYLEHGILLGVKPC